MNHSSSYSSEADESTIMAMQVVTSCVVPRALKTAIELNLLELMKKAAGPVSAAELAAQIQTANPEAHLMIDRILRLLAANNILECTMKNRPHGGSGIDCFYSLAPLCKLFTNNGNGVSLAPLLLMSPDKVLAEALYHLKDAIVEGGLPFNRAHGMSAFEYSATDPRYNKVFNQAMYEQSTMFMHEILEKYNGFEGVESLVDVGGGIGASLKMILFKYPYIKAINFDLPHVIHNAPSHPGVEHISGDMFVSVPKGDAIFMKYICHDWSDAHCLKVLKNCNEALPDNGKVIIAERMLLEIPNKEGSTSTSTSTSTSIDLAMDLLMLTYNTGGKERTEAEFRDLAKASGFKQFRKVCCALSTWIMELYK